jgi:pimeloyl-ACP methyl ester carboxylesterase
MSDQPTLLFLHGVGAGDREDEWADVLNQSLTNAGYPQLDAVKVIAPKYPHALRGADDQEPLPKITIEPLRREAAARHRRAYERRTGALEALLGRHDRGVGWAGGDTLVEVVIGHQKFIQANNYVTNPHVRAQVLNRVLRHLPRSGRLLIVGHSLGSVIAADLIRRLPADVEVTGLVTLGSPLANSNFHVEKLRQALEGPPANLAWWVNFWNVADPVTTHRGVSSIFPWMIDHRVQSPLGLRVHDATTYLKNGLVATAIGFGLFGSRSKGLVEVERGVDIPLDYAETVGLLALRFAHLTKDGLSGDKQERYAAALRQVQAATFDLIRTRNARESRPLPRAVAELAVDLTDPASAAPEPRSLSSLSKTESVIPLISIATTNVIRPFEIDVPREQRRRAMEDLTLTMGVGRQMGADAFDAVSQARDAIKAGGGPNWVKWATLGLGAAAVVAATGGLALLAAPGAIGAAAITSALAAFGPGGMIGGLLTAGTLVSAGGGSIAIGLASPVTTAATVEAVVTTQLAAAILRKSQGLEQDPTTWNSLVETAIEVRREHARLEPFSDESAPALKQLKHKLDSIDRALNYLHRHGLAPKDSAELPSEQLSGADVGRPT